MPHTNSALVVPRKTSWLTEEEAKRPSPVHYQITEDCSAFLEQETPLGTFLCTASSYKWSKMFDRITSSGHSYLWFRDEDDSLQSLTHMDAKASEDGFWEKYKHTSNPPNFISDHTHDAVGQSDKAITVYRFLHCTIAMKIHEDEVARYIANAPGALDVAKLGDLLGDARATPPTSNHDAMRKLSEINKCLAIHTEIISKATGVNMVVDHTPMPSW